MKIKSQKDFYSGIMFTLVGAAFAIGATNYNIGTGARMGPGYFPLLLGILMAILGAAIVVKSLTSGPPDGDKVGKWAWRPICYILGANFAFGVLLAGIPAWNVPAMGLIVAIYGSTLISSKAGETFNLKEALILATALAIGSYIAFVWALNLQFPVWPSFIVG